MVIILLLGRLVGDPEPIPTPDPIPLPLYILVCSAAGAAGGVTLFKLRKQGYSGASSDYFAWIASANVAFLLAFVADVIQQRSIAVLGAAPFFGALFGIMLAAAERWYHESMSS